MESAIIEAIGLVSGALTTAAFLPQVLKTYRTRRTQDISLTMYLLFALGVAGWLLYGSLIGSLAVILANAVTLALAAAVLVMKIRYK